MLRIASGTTNQYIYFTGPEGLSGWSVLRARNGGTPTLMTTPTVAAIDSSAPSVYSLLLDEDMTIDSNNYTEHMVFFVTASGWSGKLLEIELYNPDQELASIIADVASLTSSVGSIASDVTSLTADVAALNDITSADVWAELLGNSGYSASAMVQIMAGALAGKISGAGTSTITIRSLEDDANIIVATVDSNGNRSAVTITTPGD